MAPENGKMQRCHIWQLIVETSAMLEIIFYIRARCPWGQNVAAIALDRRFLGTYPNGPEAGHEAGCPQ